jgi:hypothetical protein
MSFDRSVPSYEQPAKRASAPRTRRPRLAAVWLIGIVATACADFRRGPYWDEEMAESGAATGATAGDESQTGTDTAGATGASGPSFAGEVYPILVAGCRRCHASGGSAGTTDFIIVDDVDASYETTMTFIDPANAGASQLLAKSAGRGHGGGLVYDESTPQYDTLLSWIESGANP